jgi:hypothetical protein
LHLIGGFGIVLPIIGEPPRDIVLDVVNEIEILYEVPKLHELG